MSGFLSWLASIARERGAIPAFPVAAPSTCFHCGLTMPPGTCLSVQFDGARRPVCCHGCQALFEMVIDGGLADYYRDRERYEQRV